MTDQQPDRQDGDAFRSREIAAAMTKAARNHAISISADDEEEEEEGRDALAARLETSRHCWCLEAGNREQIIKALRSPSPAVATEPAAFDPTNHHNALKCPYCNPQGLSFASPPVRGDREAIARALWVSRGGKPENFSRHWAKKRYDLPSTSLYVPFQDCLRDADAILSLLVQPGAGEREADKSRRPDDCANAMSCGWHHVRTEPEIGLYLCDKPGCPHMIRALSRQAPHSSSEVDDPARAQPEKR